MMLKVIFQALTPSKITYLHFQLVQDSFLILSKAKSIKFSERPLNEDSLIQLLKFKV